MVYSDVINVDVTFTLIDAIDKVTFMNEIEMYEYHGVVFTWEDDQSGSIQFGRFMEDGDVLDDDYLNGFATIVADAGGVVVDVEFV